MTLTPTGREIDTETGRNFQAADDEGLRVTVVVSHEALQDKDWSDIWHAAEKKYYDQDYEEAGDVRIVRIRTIDVDAT